VCIDHMVYLLDGWRLEGGREDPALRHPLYFSERNLVMKSFGSCAQQRGHPHQKSPNM